MIYLDANALYSYLGREKLPLEPSIIKYNVTELRQFLDDRADVYIPASVMMEMIVHFRNSPDSIKTILQFCIYKKIKIYNNLLWRSFQTKEMNLLLEMDNVQLEIYAFSLLNKKIEIECCHAYSFLCIVSLLYAQFYMMSIPKFTASKIDSILDSIGYDFIDVMEDENKTLLHNALTNGYADNDRVEQSLKKAYIGALSKNCILFKMIIDGVNAMMCENDKDVDIINILQTSAQDARSNCFGDSSTMTEIKTLLETDKSFLMYAETKIPQLFVKNGYTEHQAAYLGTMLQAWTERGQKLRKNDIFDMLCFGALDKNEYDPSVPIIYDQRPYLISFDKAMMSQLMKYPDQAKLLNRFCRHN